MAFRGRRDHSPDARGWVIVDVDHEADQAARPSPPWPAGNAAPHPRPAGVVGDERPAGQPVSQVARMVEKSEDCPATQNSDAGQPPV